MQKRMRRLATLVLFIIVQWVVLFSMGVMTAYSSNSDIAPTKGFHWGAVDAGHASANIQSEASGSSIGGTAIITTADATTPEAPSNLETVDDENYTLTLSAVGEGATEPSSGNHTFAAGANVRVTATAANGYTFTGWSGAATGTENPLRLEMDSNKNLTANFSMDDILPDTCPRNCNDATPVHPTVSSDGGHGNVTMYSTEASSGGACNYGATNVMYYAAIHSNVQPGDGLGAWQAGSLCGQCAEVVVVTSQGSKRVVVRIMDKCPDGNCGIDLGGLAPGELMIDGAGRYDGQWRYVSCEGHPGVSDGPPSLDVFSGSNPWWSRVHVRNGAMAVKAITWENTDGSDSGAFDYAQDPENGYEVPVTEVLQSHAPSLLITVGYVDGTTATVTLSPTELATPGSYPLDE